MYGKETRLRIGREASWGVPPAEGWNGIAPSGGKAGLSSRVNTRRFDVGVAPGVAYAVADFEAAATQANLTALAEAALERDADGGMPSYTVQVCDAAGAREVRGALARRLRIKSGIARAELTIWLEFIGKVFGAASPFAASACGKPFTFHSAEIQINSAAAPCKEFSISVNNNIFIGPSDDDNDASFLTAGRQEMTGYVILADDRRDLVDGDVHSLEVTFGGSPHGARILAPEVFFTWVREIRSAAEGALQVLYFETASGGVSSGLSISLV